MYVRSGKFYHVRICLMEIKYFERLQNVLMTIFFSPPPRISKETLLPRKSPTLNSKTSKWQK